MRGQSEPAKAETHGSHSVLTLISNGLKVNLIYTPAGYIVVAMNASNHQKLKTRLNRIAGQVVGIQRMADEGRYCVDILTQIAAVRSALDAVGVELLMNHLGSCVLGHGSGTEHKRAKPLTQRKLLTEMQTTLSRFLK